MKKQKKSTRLKLSLEAAEQAMLCQKQKQLTNQTFVNFLLSLTLRGLGNKKKQKGVKLMELQKSSTQNFLFSRKFSSKDRTSMESLQNPAPSHRVPFLKDTCWLSLPLETLEEMALTNFDSHDYVGDVKAPII